MNPRRLIQTALLVLLLLTTPAQSKDRVTEPFVGIRIYELTRTEPRPLVIRAAEIDLTAPGISFLITPSNGDPNGDEPGDPNFETTRQTTLQFLKDQHAQLAINASFFTFKKDPITDEDILDTDNIGIVVSNGDPISPLEKGWPAINIARDNTPTVIHGPDGGFTLTDHQDIKLYNAVTGSNQIVTDGKPTASDTKFSTTAHPRTAIGITDKNTLLLVTVDGRQPGFSEGISLAELGELMIELGAVQALNLDGGGSTTMTIADPDPRVVNFPSTKDEAGNPGVLRQNGTSLAVFAEPNPNYARANESAQAPSQSTHDLVSEPGSYYLAKREEVRLAPSISGPVTNRLDRQTRVEVYELKDKWARISRYYEGKFEGLSGQVARWIPASSLVKQRPSDPAQPVMVVDDRIGGIPKMGEGGLTKRDIQILNAAARYYLETGQAESIAYGDKSISKPGVYYLNFDDDFKNHFFRAEDIPDLENRINNLD